MRRPAFVLIQLAFAALLHAASPRIVFDRTLPAAHDLGGAEDIAIVSSGPADARQDLFIEAFIEHANRSGVLFVRDGRDSAMPQIHLSIPPLECQSSVQQGEGGVRDVDGNRVRRRHWWVDASCAARVDVLSKAMKRQSTFAVRGDGRSSRVDRVTAEETEEAIAEAVRVAAVEAAKRITPRRVRESVLLDETAPAFDEGMAMIEARRLERARAMWEQALGTAPQSAALRFNLGALCEALGDRRAAERHYQAARQLAPKEPRYASELKLFALRGQ